MISDTSAAVQFAYDDMIRRMPVEERLRRMMALSDLARAAAWAGAERVEGRNGRAAVLQRFFRQMYGDSFHVPPELLARARAMDTSGTDDE